MKTWRLLISRFCAPRCNRGMRCCRHLLRQKVSVVSAIQPICILDHRSVGRGEQEIAVPLIGRDFWLSGVSGTSCTHFGAYHVKGGVAFDSAFGKGRSQRRYGRVCALIAHRLSRENFVKIRFGSLVFAFIFLLQLSILCSTLWERCLFTLSIRERRHSVFSSHVSVVLKSLGGQTKFGNLLKYITIAGFCWYPSKWFLLSQKRGIMKNGNSYFLSKSHVLHTHARLSTHSICHPSFLFPIKHCSHTVWSMNVEWMSCVCVFI